jgi:hypothetical protein
MDDFNDINPLSSDAFTSGETLESWVQSKCDEWRNAYEDTYQSRHQEYYRIWRGESSREDDTRTSERSRIITPGSMQAVEENTAEIEEATFTGQLFDIRDDVMDETKGQTADIALLKKKLTEDLTRAKVQPAISTCILNAAVYGTGMAEIEMSEVIVQKVATQEIMDGAATQIGVEMEERVQVRLRPILPQNFLVDPNGSTVDDGLGVIIDEFVGSEIIRKDQENGIYMEVDVGTAANDTDIEPTQDMTVYTDDRVRRVKYFGLVPRHLLEMEKDLGGEIIIDTLGSVDGVEEKQDSYFVEAIVVLGNGRLLMADYNPYMMQDRPLVAFPWDIVPNTFYGRGVIEKAYNVQKATDTEIRSRIDALALTIHPMMAIDATRMPRGSSPTIKPGKMLKVNGNPSEILQPFKFGDVSQITFQQAGELQKMLQQATGAVNAAGMPAAAAGGAAGTGAMAMALGSVMKRHKRTLLAFQHGFLLPFIQKAAWRYMQFDAENYPVGDYNFHCEGSLGLIGREYEVSQLTFLLQTMGTESPMYPIILRSVVDNMSLTNRDELLAQLDEQNKPDEAEAQMAEQKHAMEIEVQKTTLAALAGQAHESEAKAAKVQAEMMNIEEENNIAYAKIAASQVQPEVNPEQDAFEKKIIIMEEIRKDRELNLREEDMKARGEQHAADMSAKSAEQDMLAQALAEPSPSEEMPQEPLA